MRTSIVPMLIILLLFLVIKSACIIEITGGPNITIEIGNVSSDGAPPTYDISYPSPTKAVDPSQYRSPELEVPPIPPDDNNNLSSIRPTRIVPFFFEMGGSANGSGGFSQWRSINDIGGLSAKQSSSTTSGDIIDISNRLVLVSDKKKTSSFSFEGATLLSRDYVKYSGNDYRGKECYSNNDDFIRNSFRSNRILKESTYDGRMLNQNVTAEAQLYNQSMIYRLEAGYVGTSSLFFSTFGAGNYSEISEDYTGSIVLSRKLAHQISSNRTEPAESWLSCCS